MDGQPIIIAGGGIGGLTAAIAIGQRGLPVLLVERAPEFEPIGYGIQLGPNAMHVFNKLGLLQEVLDCCSLPDAGVLSDALTNECIAELPMAHHMRARYGQPYGVIHRSDLHEVLVNRCLSMDTVQLRNDVDVVSFEDRGADVVIRDRSGEEIAGTALIGADGIWSVIRQQMFPDAPTPIASRYVAFRSLLPMEKVDAGLARNVVNLRCGTDFHLIHYPLRGGTLFNLVCGIRIPDGVRTDERDVILAHFDNAFAGACDDVKALLPLLDRSRYWPISNIAPLRQWHEGRVVLLGDSAHAMVQAMAQGACQAVEDGFVLAKHLASATTPQDAFGRYQKERHARASFTQYQSILMWELIHASHGWRDMRKSKMGALSPADVLDRLGWLYGNEPTDELWHELEDGAVAALS